MPSAPPAGERTSLAGPGASATVARSCSSVAITAASNFATQYNYNAIAWAKLWIEALYGNPAWAAELASNTIFGGTLIGMVGLGYVGDAMGRNRAMVLTLSVMAAGSLASGLTPWGSDASVWLLLVISRFLIGVGSGGVYPLSAAKAAEDSTGASVVGKAQAAGWNLVWRNPAVMWVYSFGLLFVLTIGSGARFDMAQQPYNAGWDASWRIHLAFGALPVLPLVWLAARQPESKELEAAKAATPKSTLQLLREGGWAREMVATGGAWFCYDTAYYGNALLQPRILDNMFPDDTIELEAAKNVGVACFGLAFSIATIYLLPLGTRQLQVGSLLFSAALSLLLAVLWLPLSAAGASLRGLQLALYCVLYGSFWVSKITLYVMPTEIYRVEVRSSLNGLSAAFGKVGAIVGSVCFDSMLRAGGAGQARQDVSIRRVLLVSATFLVGGALLTVVGLRMGSPWRTRRDREAAGYLAVP